MPAAERWVLSDWVHTPALWLDERGLATYYYPGHAGKELPGSQSTATEQGAWEPPRLPSSEVVALLGKSQDRRWAAAAHRSFISHPLYAACQSCCCA